MIPRLDSVGEHSSIMALFNVNDILADIEETVKILLDCFVIPDGEDIPTISILVNNKARKTAAESLSKNSGIRLQYRKGNQPPEGVLVDNPVKYCQDVLEECYADSSGLLDMPSKKAVLALLSKQPKFAKVLASKLMKVFESSELYKEAEDDEKK